MKTTYGPGHHDTKRGIIARVHFQINSPARTKFALVGEICTQGQSRLCCWDIHGHVWGYEPQDLDLRPQVVHQWRAIYHDCLGTWYYSRMLCETSIDPRCPAEALQHRTVTNGKPTNTFEVLEPSTQIHETDE